MDLPSSGIINGLRGTEENKQTNKQTVFLHLGWLLLSGKLLLTFPDASSPGITVGSLTEYESCCP